MSDEAVIQAKRGHDEAKRSRLKLEPLLNECYRLTMPGRERFGHKGADFDAEDDLYDETGVVAHQEFASRLHAGLVPANTKFVGLTAGHDVPEADRKAVNDDLAEIGDYLFELIGQSNFSSESFEMMHDVGVSTGVMVIEDDPVRVLGHKALPVTECAVAGGPNGDVTELYREREVKAQYLPGMYRHAEFDAATERMITTEADKPVQVVDALTWDPFEERARQVSYLPQTGAMMVHRDWQGHGARPFVAARFSTVAGDAYGRGPAMNALAAMKTVNQTIEYILQHAALSMVPPFHYDDDGSMPINQVQILPGAGIPRLPGTRGIEPINFGGAGFSVSDIVLQDQRLNIRRAFFNDMLADPNRTPATATEVASRMADLNQRMSAHVARLHFDFVAPYIHRALWILEDRGLIELPVVNGKSVKVTLTSPLAATQEAQEVQGLLQYHQTTAAIYGPELAAAQYDEQRLTPWLRDRMNVPTSLFLSDPQLKARLQRNLQAQVVAHAGSSTDREG